MQHGQRQQKGQINGERRRIKNKKIKKARKEWIKSKGDSHHKKERKRKRKKKKQKKEVGALGIE